MPGENTTTPASAAAPAAPATATPAATAAPASASAAPPAAAATPPPTILGADPNAPAAPAAAAAPNPNVPEKYELKAPEGQTLDALGLDAFTPVFKELGLTQAQAQKLVDTQFQVTAKAVEAAQKQAGDEVAAETAKWAKACREDKDIGGTNFEANAKIANKALAAFGSPELRTELVSSGYANHPAFVKLFWTIGQKLAESTPPGNGTPNATQQSAASVLYPTMNQH